MAIVTADHVIRVTMNYTISGVSGKANVWYFETDAATITSTVLADLGTQLTGWFADHLQDNLPTYTVLTSITLRSMEAEIAPFLTWTDDLPMPGTLTGNPLPNNATFALKLGSGLTGRNVNGRTYIPQLREEDVSTNELTSTRANAFVAAFTELLYLVGSEANYGMVVYSTMDNGQQRSTALVTPVVSVSYTDLRIDTQRRRLK